VERKEEGNMPTAEKEGFIAVRSGGKQHGGGPKGANAEPKKWSKVTTGG